MFVWEISGNLPEMFGNVSKTFGTCSGFGFDFREIFANNWGLVWILLEESGNVLEMFGIIPNK